MEEISSFAAAGKRCKNLGSGRYFFMPAPKHLDNLFLM